MKKVINVRDLLVSSGNVRPNGAKTPGAMTVSKATLRGANKVSVELSKLNAILSRRGLTSH